MGTSTQIRNWYPEGCKPPFTKPLQCDHRLVTEGGVMVAYPFPSNLIDGLPHIFLKVHSATVPYWSAFVKVMDHYGVELQSWDGGTLNCRTIKNSSYSSLHAHGVAFDILPDTFPDEFGEAVEAIRTTDGLQVFNWLGPTFDRMHSQVNIPRGKEIDWSTVAGVEEEFVIKQGATGWTVVLIQQALNRWNTKGDPPFPLVEDGSYGSTTKTAVELFQRWTMQADQLGTPFGITGEVDPITLASLLRWAPPKHGPHEAASGTVPPHTHKGEVTVS